MDSLLKDRKFQAALADIANQTKSSLDEVNAKAVNYWQELYTEHKPLAQLLGVQGAQYILSRAYDKTIDVDPRQIRALTKLKRHHPVAFVMTHKTYIDMMVLGLVLLRHGLPLPYTFAGINMAFPGLGQFGRQAGVIFIRRSFKDNLIYKATLRHFIASVVKQQGHFMWALEGTRSRTGKLVWPKMGILKYIREAELHANVPVKYVPVSIVYDLIPDVKDMTAEGLGKQKRPESFTWFLNYIRQMGENFGRISVRIGDPVEVDQVGNTYVPGQKTALSKSGLPSFAFGLANGINQITPVTTVSLVCNALLSQYALNKRDLENAVADMMQLIESHQPDALVDRGKPLGLCVQEALNLLLKANIIRQTGDGLHAKYNVTTQQYLPATYYANMAVHHLYKRSFLELALLRVADEPAEHRELSFWRAVMQLRDLFKFEFFYPEKAIFTNEMEIELDLLFTNWRQWLKEPNADIEEFLQNQRILVAPVVLYSYLEAYRVVARQLLDYEHQAEFDEHEFINACMLMGGEMKWQGQINRIESVSKPFLLNGLRLIKNKGLLRHWEAGEREPILQFINQLDNVAGCVSALQTFTLNRKKRHHHQPVPYEREHVPGSRTDHITREILDGEGGSHIGAFFDLDRTLIKGFSAKEFMQARIFSGKMSAQEVVAQFAGAITYAVGDGNFAGLAAISAKGIKGVEEDVFAQVGEEVYLKHLAHTIYPEARELVAAHLAKGHTVAIVSAATPYQVNPIARDLLIEHVMCTRMEVKDGKFTGFIVEPACWGEGKAIAAHQLEKDFDLDLSKSYFYTDSAEDLPLLEIVGNPRPMNPDIKLSAIAFQNDWPIYRFSDEERPGLTGLARTALAAGSLIPAALLGLSTGARTLSWRDGVNSMIANVGDLGTAMAGTKLVVKGEQNLWESRPAVFLFNHQSSADLFIVAKLLRRDITAVAKKELQRVPILGQLMEAAGVIFLDRSNREKAIEALKPAVEALKNGMSIAVAPEGTRSKDYTLGRFKKGAFHLAMQAGVPVVPIVIKNAHDVMPKGTNLFQPGAVEVVILPAVPTEDWCKDTLNERIAMVRQHFLDELGQSE